MTLSRKDQQAAVLHDSFIDGTNPVPSPGLDAFAHRVVQDDRDVGLVDLELGAALRFQFLLGEIRGNKSEILAGDAVSFRRIAVPPVGKCFLAHTASDHDNVAADLFTEVLLKDASIVNLYAFDHEILLSLVTSLCSLLSARLDGKTLASTSSMCRSISLRASIRSCFSMAPPILR